MEKIQDFDYEVKDEKVDGDAATVKVQITTYNFGTAYKEMYHQVVKDANSGKLTSKTDLNEYIYKMMFNKMNALTKKDYKKNRFHPVHEERRRGLGDRRGHQFRSEGCHAGWNHDPVQPEQHIVQIAINEGEKHVTKTME